jgi:hypothetical protein
MPKMSLLIPSVDILDSDEVVLRLALLHKRIYIRSIPRLSFALYKTIIYEITDKRKQIVKEFLRVICPFLEGNYEQNSTIRCIIPA